MFEQPVYGNKFLAIGPTVSQHIQQEPVARKGHFLTCIMVLYPLLVMFMIACWYEVHPLRFYFYSTGDVHMKSCVPLSVRNFYEASCK